MAEDEELPPEAEQTDAPAEDVVDDTPEPITNLASEMGWAPKEQWKGDPDKWKPADQFIRDGREIQQSTARELRSMREQMERLGGVTSQIIQDKVAERDTYWQSQFNQAVEEGDTERLFERQTGRHHLAEEKGDVLARQGAGIGVLQATKHLRLTFRAVNVPCLAMLGLDLANFLGAARTLVEQAQQFAVDAIDFGADAGQGFLQIVAHRCLPVAFGKVVHEIHQHLHALQ